MKNLVIGGEGFIGKSFVNFLKSKDEEVVVFDIKNGINQDARVVEIDFDNIDRVYFLAWDVGGAKFLYNENLQLEQLNGNLKLLQNVMMQLEKHKKPFLFISSQLAEEYDTVYGVTKRLGEVWTRLLNGTFIRQWNVYGPVEKESIRSHVVSDFVSQAINTKEIRMMTTGQEKRQFIHIDDVCEAWYMAMEMSLKGIHDVTSFEWVRVIDLANIIGELTGAIVIPGEKVGSTPETPIKGKVPGWQPKTDLKTGLAKMVKDMKNIKNK
jgi:nucleoside-diphosphate-sugar epimerase